MIFLVFLIINGFFISDILCMPSSVLNYSFENGDNDVYGSVFQEEEAETTTEDSKVLWEDRLTKHSDQKFCLLILNSNQTDDYRSAQDKIHDVAPHNLEHSVFNKTAHDKYRELCECMLKKGLQAMIKQFPYSVICKKYVNPTEGKEVPTTIVIGTLTTVKTEETTTKKAHFTTKIENTVGTNTQEDSTKVFEIKNSNTSESTTKADGVTAQEPISKHGEINNQSEIETDIKEFLFDAEKYQQNQMPALMQFKSVLEPKLNNSVETQDFPKTEQTPKPENQMKTEKKTTNGTGKVYEYHPKSLSNKSRIANFKYHGEKTTQDSNKTHFKNTEIDLAFGDSRNLSNTLNNDTDSGMKNILTINGNAVIVTPESTSNGTKYISEKIAQNSATYNPQFKIGINPARSPESQDDLNAIEHDMQNDEKMKMFLTNFLPPNTSPKHKFKEFCINMQSKGFNALLKEYPFSMFCSEYLTKPIKLEEISETFNQANNEMQNEPGDFATTSKPLQDRDFKINFTASTITNILDKLNTSKTIQQTTMLSNLNSNKKNYGKGNSNGEKSTREDMGKKLLAFQPIRKLPYNQRSDKDEKISIKERRSDNSPYYKSDEEQERAEVTEELETFRPIHETPNKQFEIYDSHSKTRQDKLKITELPSYIQKIPKKTKSEIENQGNETDGLTILETSFTLASPETTKKPLNNNKRRKRGLSEDVLSTAQSKDKQSKKLLKRLSNDSNKRRRKYRRKHRNVKVETVETTTSNSSALNTKSDATNDGEVSITDSLSSENSKFVNPKEKIYNVPLSKTHKKGKIAIIMDLKDSDGAEARIKMHIKDLFSLSNLFNGSKQHFQNSNSPGKIVLEEYAQTTNDADFSLEPTYLKNNNMEIVPLETESNEGRCNIKCFGKHCEHSNPVCTYSDSDGRHLIHFDNGIHRSNTANKTKNPVIFIVEKKPKNITGNNVTETFNNPEIKGGDDEVLSNGNDFDDIKLIHKGEDLINTPNGTIGEFESFEIVGTDDKKTDYTYIILGKNGIKIKTNNKNEKPILVSQEVYDSHEKVTKLDEDFQSVISDFNFVTPNRYKERLGIARNDDTTHVTSTKDRILKNGDFVAKQDDILNQALLTERIESEIGNIAKYLANMFINNEIGATVKHSPLKLINKSSIQNLTDNLAVDNSTEHSLRSSYSTTIEKSTKKNISTKNLLTTKDPIISVLHFLKMMKNTELNNSKTNVEIPTSSPKVIRQSRNDYFNKENSVCSEESSISEDTVENCYRQTYDDCNKSIIPYLDKTYEDQNVERRNDSTKFENIDDEILSAEILNKTIVHVHTIDSEDDEKYKDWTDEHKNYEDSPEDRFDNNEYVKNGDAFIPDTNNSIQTSF